MHITIAERLHPFSHSPGTYCLLPGTALRLQIFPARIYVHDLSGSQPRLVAEMQLEIEGPVNDFTIKLDLEKGSILVWGQTLKGFLRYRVTACRDSASLEIVMEKVPQEGLAWKALNSWTFFSRSKNQEQQHAVFVPSLSERLSLGSHKSQDWQMVLRRRDLKEIFPIWLKLAQQLPEVQTHPLQGTAELLEACRQAKVSAPADKILLAFHHLAAAGFEGILSPRLTDTDYQGFHFKPLAANSLLSPLLLLQEGARIIRSLLVEDTEKGIAVLQALPSEFHCGRFLHVRVDGGILDLEWSKKFIRRMVFTAEKDALLVLRFQKNVKRYRVREENRTQGKFQLSHEPLNVLKGRVYFFDRFEA